MATGILLSDYNCEDHLGNKMSKASYFSGNINFIQVFPGWYAFTRHEYGIVCSLEDLLSCSDYCLIAEFSVSGFVGFSAR